MTSDASSTARLEPSVALGLALVSSLAFVAIALPVLAALPHDFDEGWFVLDARFLARGARPFVDFAHHDLPLHLYLLAAAGEVFGPSLFGYRLLSLLSLAASGLVLFALARPFVGTIPALAAQAIFLFSTVQDRSMTAVPETPALLLTLIGAWLLFVRRERWSAWASGAVFVLALLVKPNCLAMIGAAALSLAWAREWRRLADLTIAGVATALAGLAWVAWLSDGIFTDVLRLQLTRIGTHTVGMWAIDSGFADMRRLGGIATAQHWAWVNVKTFFHWPAETLPAALAALAALAVPVWLLGCGRRQPALQAFVVLWPASYLVLNFLVMDFVSPRYFIPTFGFVALLAAGWVWLVERLAGRAVAGILALAGTLALAGLLATSLGHDADHWFWGRSQWIADAHPRVVSFTPIHFAATGTEPACGLSNPALTYGAFGENFLVSERMRGLRVSDASLLACLRADPTLPVVVDWAFYFFTRPGSPLRAYLAGEGERQRLFFSPDAVTQWDRPILHMSPMR